MKILSFVLFFCLTFASNFVVNVENGFAHKSGEPRQIQISSVDKRDAENLFKAMARDEKIPYKFPLDGCYARATAMAQIAEKRGINVGKIFAEGTLQAKTKSEHFPVAKWGWHVATVVFVKQPGGKSVPMVLDPSLFDRPVTEEEWQKALLFETADWKPQIRRIYYGSRFQYKIDLIEPSKSSWNPREVKDAHEVMARYLELQALGPDLPRSVYPMGGTN